MRLIAPGQSGGKGFVKPRTELRDRIWIDVPFDEFTGPVILAEVSKRRDMERAIGHVTILVTPTPSACDLP